MWLYTFNESISHFYQNINSTLENINICDQIDLLIILLTSFEVLILSLGTDGQDGPTDAAGAVADVQLINKSGFSLAEAKQFLENNDSYNFFAKAAEGAYHIKTG